MGDSSSGNEGFQVLLRRVRAGDGQAAAELVRRYEPAIRRAARVRLVDTRLNRLLDSMDICQSVLASFFVRTALGQYELETPEQLLKLLATMARNKLANQVKGHRATRRDFRRIEAGGGDGGGDTSVVGGIESLAGQGPTPSREVAARTPGRSPAATLARGVVASGTARARPRVDRDCRRAALQPRGDPQAPGSCHRPRRSRAGIGPAELMSKIHPSDPTPAPQSPALAQAEAETASWQSPLPLVQDHRQRWRRGERMPVEAYLEQFRPAGVDAADLLDLVYNEVVLREEDGESPQLDEYLDRFPGHDEALRAQFDVHQLLRTSGSFSRRTLLGRTSLLGSTARSDCR